MAIDVFLLGRSRRGIVMHARPFDQRPVAFGGRIVDGEQHMARGILVEIGLAENPAKQLVRDPLSVASHAAQEVIIRFVVGADSLAAQPRRDGAAPDGEQHSRKDNDQPPAISSMQTRRQPLGPLGQFLGTKQVALTSRNIHPWPSCTRSRFMQLDCEQRAISTPANQPYTVGRK